MLCKEIWWFQVVPHLHVDFLEPGNEVPDLAEGKAPHPRRCSYANQQHPFLLSLLELLLDKINLRHRQKQDRSNSESCLPV